MLQLVQWSVLLWLGGRWALGWASSLDDAGDGGGHVIAIVIGGHIDDAGDVGCCVIAVNAGDGGREGKSLLLLLVATLMMLVVGSSLSLHWR